MYNIYKILNHTNCQRQYRKPDQMFEYVCMHTFINVGEIYEGKKSKQKL